MILWTQRPRRGETHVSASPKPQDPENTAENGAWWSKAKSAFFALNGLMVHSSVTMPMPEKKRCQCGATIEEFEDECAKCARMCVCGRKLPYGGRGRPHSRCPRCAELRPDYRACGACGAMVPRSRHRWCSAACAREARKVQRGELPGDAWQRNLVNVLDQQDVHAQVARYLAAWPSSWMVTATNNTLRGPSISERDTLMGHAAGLGFPLGSGMRFGAPWTSSP